MLAECSRCARNGDKCCRDKPTKNPGLTTLSCGWGPLPPPPRPETRWCHREWRGALRWTWRPQAADECPWTSAGRGGGPEKEALPATSTAQGRCPLCGPATGSTAPGASLCSCFILWGRCPRTGTTTSASTQDPEGAWRSQS